ncbi:MAG: hypothetical protein ACOC3V_02270 [bacterium]
MSLLERKMKLKEDILRKQKELEQIEKLEDGCIIPVEDYTDEEKINYFDKTYAFAKQMLTDLENSGYSNEDNEHYAFEHVVEILNIKNKRKLWDYWNSIN